MKKRLKITRDEGRKIFNYLKKITGEDGVSANSLNTIEECNQAILSLMGNSSEEIKELKLMLEISEAEKNNLSDLVAILEQENINLKKINAYSKI